uniref:G-protein coupled receptors family 1 profile domain-containing protein n=1 Tax=Anopheles minimus TaxID=112268 RepID=A0A182WM51_9DIPT
MFSAAGDHLSGTALREDYNYGRPVQQMLLLAGRQNGSAMVDTDGTLNADKALLMSVPTIGVLLMTTSYAPYMEYPPTVSTGPAGLAPAANESSVQYQQTTVHPVPDATLQPVHDFDQQTFVYYAEVLSVINFYYVPALVLFGSIGNVLSVLVFFKTKLRKLSSSYYLAALGLSDTFYLIGQFVAWLNLVDLKIYIQEVCCRFFTFSSSLCCFLSVWFVVAFTVERFIAVLYPLKRQTMCTVRRAKIVIFALTIAGIFISLPIFFFASPQFSASMNDTICDIVQEYKDQAAMFNFLDFILVFVVPFTIIVVLNTITALTVWKFASIRRTMTIPRSYGANVRESRRQLNISNNQLYGNGTVPVQQIQLLSRSRVANSQIKVTKMLLIVSTVFVCLNLPSYIVRVKIYLETEHTNMNIYLVQNCCQLFFMTNFGINFILYCVSGQNFRKAIFGMFQKRTQRQINLEHTSGTQVTEFVLRANGSKMRRNTTTLADNAEVATWRELTDYEITNFIKYAGQPTMADARVAMESEGAAANLTETELVMELIGNFLNFYYMPLLVVVGSIGNILSVLVFFNTKLKKLSSSYYLAALGISDTCYLVGLFVTWLSFFQVHIYTREPYCQLFTYTSGVSSFLSVWYVVAFTFERFIVVRYPLKRQSWCTVRRAKTIIACLTMVGSVHSVPYIFYAGTQYTERNVTICDMRKEYTSQMEIFNYIDTVIVFVVPFTIIVVLNSVTSFTVWRFAGLRRNMTLPKRKPSNLEIRRQLSFQYFSTHPNGRNGILRRSSMRENRMLHSQMKVTKMLLIVSSVFVCLNLPSYVMRVRAFVETGHSYLTVLVQYYCYLFFITNFGINFILYCISGQNFRKAVIEMFRRHRKSRVNQDPISGCGTQSELLRAYGHLALRRTSTPMLSTTTTTTTNRTAETMLWKDYADPPVMNLP